MDEAASPVDEAGEADSDSEVVTLRKELGVFGFDSALDIMQFHCLNTVKSALRKANPRGLTGYSSRRITCCNHNRKFA